MPKDSEFIKHRLLNDEIVKILTPLEAKVIIDKKYKGESISGRFGSLKLLKIDMIFLPDHLIDEYPDLFK